MADRKALHLDVPPPGIVEPFDSVRRKDQVEIEGTILELDEVLAALDFAGLLVRQGKAKFPESGHQCPAVLGRTFHKQVRVLGRIGKAEQDRAGLADEQVPHTMAAECIADFLRLAIFKCAHNPTNQADSPRTSGGNPPCCRRIDKGRHPGPACTCG